MSSFVNAHPIYIFSKLFIYQLTLRITNLRLKMPARQFFLWKIYMQATYENEELRAVKYRAWGKLGSHTPLVVRNTDFQK